MAIKFVLVEIVLVETVLVGDPLYISVTHLTFNCSAILTELEHSSIELVGERVS